MWCSRRTRGCRAEIVRQLERLVVVQIMIGEVGAERDALLAPAAACDARDKIRLLVRLRRIGFGFVKQDRSAALAEWRQLAT